MFRDEVLSYPANKITEEQRKFYFKNGYLELQNFVPKSTLKELNKVTNQFINKSKKIKNSDRLFDLAPEHSNKKPLVRRIKRPDEQHSVYWNFASGLIADLACDLAGPDVVFHHSKLNFKWFDDSDKVNWHQDIQFFPHTNYNVFTIGCYLEDTDMDNGPLGVLPASHEGKLYNQYDSAGNWKGALSKEDVKNIDLSKVQYLMGAAGSITIHNCRTLHSSPPSKSQNPRPLLLNCYSSADAKAYTPHPDKSKNAYRVVRGRQSLWAKHDPRPCLIPPDWSGGYTSIYAAQSGEDK
jgi:hypothetical protein